MAAIAGSERRDCSKRSSMRGSTATDRVVDAMAPRSRATSRSPPVRCSFCCAATPPTGSRRVAEPLGAALARALDRAGSARLRRRRDGVDRAVREAAAVSDDPRCRDAGADRWTSRARCGAVKPRTADSTRPSTSCARLAGRCRAASTDALRRRRSTNSSGSWRRAYRPGEGVSHRIAKPIAFAAVSPITCARRRRC